MGSQSLCLSLSVLSTVQSLLLSVRLTQLIMDTQVVLVAMTRRTTSATRYQTIRNMTSVNTLWTQPILKNVSMLHTLIVRRNTLRFSMNLMLLVMTLMWSIMDLMVMEDITSVKLMLKLLMVDTLKDIPMVLSAMTRRTNSATRSPSHRSTRSARRLWTPPTLRSVRRLCTLIVKKNTRKFITAAM